MNRLICTAVVFSFFFIMLFTLLLININDFGLIVTEAVYQFVLIIACVGITSTGLNIYVLLTYRQYKINRYKQKERSVHEFYHYHELFDPPVMNT